ncbi:hypothetical protein [Nocardia africana]|uniref:Uncharacterized protein n=1 Tax=Nocardia africana TaxID=134964 RepID=A0ABW6NT40_9NOCA
MSRPLLIASMLPLAVFLGTGVAAASPGDLVLTPADAAQAPAVPPLAVDWQTVAHDVQGLLPFPLPLPPTEGPVVQDNSAVAPQNAPVDAGWAPAVTADGPPVATAAATTPDAVPVAPAAASPASIADVLPVDDQHPVETFCEQVPADPDRCAATVVDAGVGAAIGAGIGAAVSAPLAIPAAALGAAAGFVVGIPFLPTGLVAGPLIGAAVGAAIVAAPAAALGAALGAAVGTIVGITAPVPPKAAPADAPGATDASGPAAT